MKKQNEGRQASRSPLLKRFHPAWRKGFSLVEMMTAVAVLALIMVLVLTITDTTSKLSSQSTSRLKSFQGARSAYEELTRKLSQATLNTYWDYDNPTIPTTYKRQSELHFLCGPASLSLLQTAFSNTPNVTTQAIFFQAPLGGVSSIGNSSLNQLLNACGYYIQFGVNSNLPSFLSKIVSSQYRYRLMEWQPPSEQLAIYQYTSGFPNYDGADWINSPGNALSNNSYSLADNIIALLVLPMLSAQDPSLPANPNTSLTTNYYYDSRAQPGVIPQPTNQHQLPPLVEVVMVAIDDTSALRLAAENGSAPPAEITSALNGLFADPTKLQSDLSLLETSLQSNHITYETFDTNVSIRAAKWSN